MLIPFFTFPVSNPFWGLYPLPHVSTLWLAVSKQSQCNYHEIPLVKCLLWSRLLQKPRSRTELYVWDTCVRACVRSCLCVCVSRCMRACVRDARARLRACAGGRGGGVILSRTSHDIPRSQWRGLEIGGGNLLPQKGVLCIFRCLSIWVRISGIIWVSEYFGEITKRPKLIDLREMHALLRLAHAVSPVYSTDGNTSHDI